jgi:hypothetical protein
VSHVAALRRAAVLTAASLTLVLAACGGGGGGGATDAATGSVSSRLFPDSSSLAGVCTLDGQQRWLRSYMHEAYLWSDEIPEVNAPAHGSLAAYFGALLVRTPDPAGRARDRFSTTMSSAAADVMQNVASASAAPMGSATAPVPLNKVVTSPNGRRVGYLLFNEHSRGAQDALIGAFAGLRDAAVQDLVLDLRYNSGGFIYVAQTAAAMVAGSGIDGRLFESVRFNDRRAGQSASETFYFSTRVQRAESAYPVGHPLPQLALPRLYVLTSALTCSASESIINSLRGIGVQVILVGDRTCGKPYGFYRKDNCGQAYFPIEFQVYNEAGFGDFQDGFPVQCRVTENPNTALGSATEPLLAAALGHIDTGSCPGGTATAFAASSLAATGLQQSGAASMLDRPEAPPADSPMYQPGWNGRLLRP